MPRGRPPATAYTEDGRPKGKMTAYAFFVQTCREAHKRQHPDENVVFSEFGKKCADRWKTMSDKEKKRFNQMAEDDKQRYEVEMAAYVPKSQQNQAKSSAAKTAGGPLTKAEKLAKKEKRLKKKKMKDPNAPKRALSAFFWFAQDERSAVRAANPTMAVGEIAKEMGRRWAEVSPERKAKYESMAETDRERYDREKKAYQKGSVEKAADARDELRKAKNNNKTDNASNAAEEEMALSDDHDEDADEDLEDDDSD